MVQVRTASYGMTKNLGNYESYRVYLEGNLDESESYLDAIATLKTICETDFKKEIKKNEKLELNDIFQECQKMTKRKTIKDFLPQLECGFIDFENKAH